MKIILLCDYKGFFGAKNSAVPRLSGMDLRLLQDCFARKGCEIEVLHFTDIDFRARDFRNECVIYTSSEDKGLHYKDFIEDILLGLQRQGAVLVPDFYMFRAHHNKVFMEILRDQAQDEALKNLRARVYGTLEDLDRKLPEFGPVTVVKTPDGAMSSGVALAESRTQLLKNCAQLSETRYCLHDLWDRCRVLKHPNYRTDSVHRKKFLVQEYIGKLNDDWKVLVYADKYYALNRNVRDNDFRASGSGKFAFREDIPMEILDYAARVFAALDVPNVSLDIGYKDGKCYLIEFQAIYFGTKTLEDSPFYFTKNGDIWNKVDGSSVLEEEYAESICSYLVRRQNCD